VTHPYTIMQMMPLPIHEADQLVALGNALLSQAQQCRTESGDHFCRDWPEFLEYPRQRLAEAVAALESAPPGDDALEALESARQATQVFMFKVIAWAEPDEPGSEEVSEALLEAFVKQLG